MDKRKLKKDWDLYTKDLNKLMETIGHISALIPPSADNEKLKKRFLKQAEIVANRANKIEQIITEAPDPIEVNMPFDSEEFKVAWDYYMHYLDEAHNLSLSSTVENKRLQLLFRYSERDEKKAIAILDFHICQNYSAFYKLKENQLSAVEDSSTNNKETTFTIPQGVQI